MERQNQVTEYPVNELIDNRWSPRAFDPERLLLEEHVQSLFEAVRWAPSSYNAQPWQYIYALSSDRRAFSDLLGCLSASNQIWAQNCGLLILSLVQEKIPGKEKINSFARYDLGGANYALTIQALSMGLFVHQMGGFDEVKIREIIHLPNGLQPVVFLGVGFRGEAEQLPYELRLKEVAKKPRIVQSQFVRKMK